MDRSWERPKIHIAKTKSEWVWDIIGYSTFIAGIYLTIAVWKKLPAEIPAHYNALGEVDRWGSKTELLILPLIGLFSAIFLHFIEKHPEVHNYPKRFNESNAEQFYLHSRKMVNQIKNICLLIFTFIQFESISIALKWREGFGGWFLPLILLATMLPVVLGIVKQRKIK